MEITTEKPVSVDDARQVKAFLLREARLLDHECWDDWLMTMSEQIHYWMPGIENRRREDKSGPYTAEHMAFSTTPCVICNAGLPVSSNPRHGLKTRQRAMCTSSATSKCSRAASRGVHCLFLLHERA